MKIQIGHIKKISIDQYEVVILAGVKRLSFTFLVDGTSVDADQSFYDFFGINSGLTVVIFKTFTKFLAGQEVAFPIAVGEMVKAEEVRNEVRQRWEKINATVGV